MTSYWYHIQLNDNDVSDIERALDCWEKDIRAEFLDELALNWRLARVEELRKKIGSAETIMRSGNNFGINPLPPIELE